MATQIKGMDKILRNLNKEINKIEGGSMKGLIRAAIIVRRDMDKTHPLIPVDEGNLRGSWFTDPRKTSKGLSLRFGFTAEYAWYVHEMVGANFQRPNAGAKFFEASLKRNDKNGEILRVIKEEAKR